MVMKRMNKKDLKYQGFADFDDPHRGITTGRHTTLEAHAAQMKRSARHGRSPYGWVWAEYQEATEEGIRPIVTVNRLIEVVLRPHREWSAARIRALAENELIVTMTSHADCCLKMTHCIDDHIRTARHFKYWCLQFPELAVRTWPWLKDLIAEEVLTCEQR